jgi:hypothetical protein
VLECGCRLASELLVDGELQLSGQVVADRVTDTTFPYVKHSTTP